MAALERNGVSFVGGGLGKARKDGSGKQLMGRAALLQLPATVRIDIPPTSPGRAALKVWEELVNVLRKDRASRPRRRLRPPQEGPARPDEHPRHLPRTLPRP